MGDPGITHANRSYGGPSYMPSDPGRYGGGTYTSQDVEPTIEAYENIFGPSARDIKQDLQRFKRHGRWHLPDILKGPNQYLTDRIDGLITDATNSPFTSRILPYKYITNVDGKIKWNVWSFDEGLASRVPYESAARTLTQSKRSFSGYTVRQGMAIVLEHNFMMTEAGRTNFQNQLNQLIGSIQQTNDLDVHVALVLAPSYAKTVREKYISEDKTSTQICRQFVDLFGFMQKNANALDILIEEAKAELRSWGGPSPDFMLCNSKLTFNMTMTPDVTNYVTQGPEGPKRLKAGPNLQSYRGIGIVHTRAFSMETGAPPRDILRRRVRVAEYYHIPPSRDNHARSFQLYNEERDTWFTLTFRDLLRHAQVPDERDRIHHDLPGQHNARLIQEALAVLEDPSSRTGDAITGTVVLGAHPHPAHLGTMVTGNDAGDDSAAISAFFAKAFTAPGLDFIGPYKFIAKNMVYVPGAMDAFEKGIYTLTTAAAETVLPAPILIGYKRVTTRISFTGGEAVGLACVAQSVAKYPRNVNYVIGKFENSKATDLNAPKLFPAAVGELPYLSSGGNSMIVNLDPNSTDADRKKICHRFLCTLALRNYNRYGIPRALCRNPDDILKPGPPANLQQVFDFSKGTEIINNPYDQLLRPLGAFCCPNHYKHENNIPFRNLGDYAGYNFLLTKELLEALTLRNYKYDHGASSTDAFGGTLLFDIISDFSAHTDVLVGLVTVLDKMRTFAPTGRETRRWELTAEFHDEILKIIRDHAASKKYDKPSLHQESGLFWTWPRANSLEEDVFHENNKSGFANIVRKHTQSVSGTDLGCTELTLALVKEMAGTKALDYKNYKPDDSTLGQGLHAMSAHGRVADTEAARNFLNMLAWRMWADQEFQPPGQVNEMSSHWPPALRFLRPEDKYHMRDFGGGLIDPVKALGYVTNADATEDIEVVIVRPNIEHYMMGIILGQGGEGLGSTFWGQTELSCYDDSMHGIWGMSYKYNERAIVINERNLIRLWDVAYDSYVGGKGEQAVKWEDDDNVRAFWDATRDVTKHYRGPSMMVMAFSHADRKDGQYKKMYDEQLKPNLPSPLVFCDNGREDGPTSLAGDFDNLHVVDTDEFRVFNKPIYKNAYGQYKRKMPDFETLHRIRKNAGLASVENEVSSDALAFQGSMKVLNATGARIAEIDGSGHHGPDFTGCASLRSGKGYKINAQPTVQRLV